MPLLYDAVALGMWAYTRSAFRVRTLGRENVRLEPGTVLVSTHRRETDVPLICPALYFDGGLWADRSRRVSFAARDDMFAAGFFAGFPRDLPALVRRLLYPLEIREVLMRALQVYPIRSASRLRVGAVLEALPDAELDEALPRETAAGLRTRAADLGLPVPRRGRDVLRGEYADLLWRFHGRESLDGDLLEPVWRSQTAAATADFRRLVDIVRRGAVLLVFPEGRPSADGDIGPLRPGLAALVRRARPARVIPIALAYDPLGPGRTRAYVAFGPAVRPAEEDVEERMLALLRRTTPLTCAQIVASALAEGWAPRGADLAREVEAARAEGRAFEPALARRGERERLLAEALAAAKASSEKELQFLAREYRSARA